MQKKVKIGKNFQKKTRIPGQILESLSEIPKILPCAHDFFKPRVCVMCVTLLLSLLCVMLKEIISSPSTAPLKSTQ
jgi:hypothetical protein